MTERRFAPAALAAALLASGCMSLAPRYDRPAAPVAGAFPIDMSLAASQPAASEIEWQAFFRDERLQRLIGIALNVARKPEMAQHGEAYHLIILLARIMLAQGQLKQAGKMLEGIWPQVIKTRFSPLVAETAMGIGELYKQMAKDAPSEISKKHLVQSIQFYQRAHGIWLELKNSYRIKQVREATPNL